MTTLHSLLKLTISGDNFVNREVKYWQNFSKVKGVKYIWIDEFSVTGQKMSGWVYRRLHQANSKLNLQFGGLSLLSFCDFTQLPPVSDKPLYHSLPENNTGLMVYSAYLGFQTVVELSENQ